MIIPINGNKLPLKAGDILSTHFTRSLQTFNDYLLSTWIAPSIYLHVAFVICDYDPETSSDPTIILDAVKRRINPRHKRRHVTLRKVSAFLRNMKVLYVGRLGNTDIEKSKIKNMLKVIIPLCHRDTAYSMIRFKCPNSNPPTFSCYGLVEYCYELLNKDLVLDDRYVGKHWLGIPRFRPTHQQKAFELEQYAFNGKSVL